MAANLLNVWGTIGSVLLAILILLVMITIHEFGHWIVGTLLRFKINEFSIGFGPALFKRKSKKTGELFAIRLIPLGGYCAFEGEDDLGEEEEKKNEAEEPVFEDVQPTPQKSEQVIITEAEPEPQTTPESGTKEEPLTTPESKIKEEAISTPESGEAPQPAQEKKEERGKFNDKKPWQRILVLLAGATMNYLLALVLIFILFGACGQSLVKVTGIKEEEGYTTEYSLRKGDILVKAEGEALYLTTDLASALNGKKTGDLVTFTVFRETEDGKLQETEQSVMLRQDVKIKSSAKVSAVWGALGIDVETREDGKYYCLETASHRFGFFETIGRSFVYSFKIAGSIFKVIGELLTGNLGIDALGGPVTTIKMTSEVASQSFRGFLEISSYIGVNLAVFNLLPIPALDGSKIVFTIIEWIRKKPLNRKVEAIIHAAGFILLLGFAVLVDILQFV